MIKVFKIECLTNLHVGSGDINYNIVDNEVEKDPVTGYPMIHSSGVKGALRDYFAGKLDSDKVVAIFGKPGDDGANLAGRGQYKFLDANMLARPMRVNSDHVASLPVTSVSMINNFIYLCSSLGYKINGGKPITDIDFGNNEFLVNCKTDRYVGSVEGEKTDRLSNEICEKLAFLKPILGENFAIARDFNGYDLPVLARNCLVEGKDNLWYEEIVPHGSIFSLVIITPDDKEFELEFGSFVQFGAHSSIGRGFCKVTALEEC